MAPLIDFHTHFFSRKVFETFAAASPLGPDPEELLARIPHTLEIDVPDPDPARHLQRWLSELDRHGVAHAVSFASVPEELPLLLELAPTSAGRLHPFALVDPTRPQAAGTLDAHLAGGVLRGAVFFPSLHGYRLDGPEAGACFEVLEQRTGVAVVHCGLLRIPLRERFGLPRQLRPALANPLDLVPVADRLPGLPLVIPHFGAGLLRETLLAGAQCPNLYVDSSSSQGWLATQAPALSLADVFERALGVFGPGRILFGTDSSVFPRGWRRDLLLAQREALGACGLGERERAQILGGNAARLLRLG